MKKSILIFSLLTALMTFQASALNSEEEKFTKQHKHLLERLTELYINKEALKEEKEADPKIDFESERARKINQGFERMIQFVHVLGQLDNFVSDRTKNLIRKINAIYDVEDNENLRKSRSNF